MLCNPCGVKSIYIRDGIPQKVFCRTLGIMRANKVADHISSALDWSELLEFALVDDIYELSDAGAMPDDTFDFDASLREASNTDSQQPEPSPLTREEKKRQSARERGRRKYYRRKEVFRDLQRQVTSLEQQLNQLRLTDSPSIPPGPPCEEAGIDGGPSRFNGLLTQLTRVKQAQAHLRSENAHLRQQFRVATQRTVLIMDLLKAEHMLYSAHSSYFHLLKPLSLQTCWELNRQALKKMYAFEAELPSISAIGTLGGWRGKRFVSDNLFKFALDKMFHHVNPQKVISDLWSNLVDPRKLEKMHSAEMGMLVRLVQKIDEDNYVFLEEMRSTDPGDSGALVKTAVLFSRLKTATGYRIHVIYLDRQQIAMEDRSTGKPVDIDGELWISSKKLSWIDLEVVDDETISDKFRGMLPTIGASAYFWMSEVVLVCLRAEILGFGPRFCVPPS